MIAILGSLAGIAEDVFMEDATWFHDEA